MVKDMIRRTRRVAVLAAALAVVPAAGADAALIETDPCDGAELTKAFSQWGDPALYKLAPGGDFEQGTGGMTLRGGAGLTADSEPWGVTGAVGDSAMKLPAGASVTLPASCVNAGNPTFRFFARSSGGLLGLLPALKVDVIYRDGALREIPVPAGTVLPSSGWRPTLHQLTLSVVGAAVAGGEAPLAIRLTSVAGTWKVDDVLVDPYRRA